MSTASTNASKAGSLSEANLTTRPLGDSNLHLTRIGFGAWATGGGNWEFAWGAQDDNESVRTIEHALDLGINWIDTAAIYGLGHSEEIVAKALKHVVKKPYVFTKCSMRWTEDRQIYRSLKPGSIQEEIEASLRRLRVDTIDLYQIHWPNPDDEIEEGWEAMAKLQQQGKVRYLGVSNFNVDQIKRVQKIAPVTSLQPPYSLLNRSVEAEILPYCLAQNIGVINYSPMASGLLSGKMTAKRIQQMPQDDWRKRSPNFNEPKLSQNLKLVERLKEIGQEYGVEPGAVAVAWTLQNPAITAAIVGARRPDQVDGTLAAAALVLKREEIAKIGEFINTTQGARQ
ncbi:putative aldo/keto reductase [Acidisarcina polymorpha]|uniref:Putative aldo/keto reductase n=1 Tax=Acidisarcina polymorpha TaxID=2211140 RepID=A0A2Z5FTK0_9BACT|nr:aldo/keto reductase [Acidisarcina polymorpha]AXC09826.1 putative aldo/keto reductase [Acidisarcina polymorpha]